MKSTLKALFVITGTLIGAGFASGQEIYIFFYQYGINGIWGIILSSLLIGFTTYKVLDICEKSEVTNYKTFLQGLIKRKKQIDVFNIIINIFILITFYIMIAGFGVYFQQQFGIYFLIGSSILSLICYLVFTRDVSGLIRVSQYIVPLLIFSVLIIGTYVIDFKNIFSISNYVPENSSLKWVLDSILYASYNTILLIPVLIALRKLVKNSNGKITISILTFCVLVILSLIIFFILAKVDVDIKNLEMPAVYVVSKILLIFQYIYGFVILGSILTTSISLGISLLENVAKNDTEYKRYAILICISAIFISNIGFSNLISLLYPIFGYIGFVQIIKISIKK